MRITAALRRWFAGKEVLVLFAIFMGGWLLAMIFDQGVFGGYTETVVTITIPLLLPWYLAALFVTRLRLVYFPGLESGMMMYLVLTLAIYAQAVLGAGIYRTFRGAIRSYRYRNSPELTS